MVVSWLDVVEQVVKSMGVNSVLQVNLLIKGQDDLLI